MNDNDDITVRPAKDEQMRALKKAHGEPRRQSELPPKISERALEPPVTKGEED